ncbi:MAG: helix-turn-helix domain-containing protein [Thermoanaerobaculia bacterium]
MTRRGERSAMRAGGRPGPFEGLGAALQNLRKATGLSRVELARRSGVSESMLSRYESGKAWPNLATLDAVLTGLRRDALDLALELYREQAQAKQRDREALEAPNLLATPVGQQILHQARLLYYTGSFWIDLALTLLPAARRETPPQGEPGN